MPATYAHFAFGQQAAQGLPPAVREAVREYPQLYQVGFHGPDPLFFYNPFFPNAIYHLGSQYHWCTGSELFPKICPPAEDRPRLAYIFGLLTHYCLDSLCHPYVNRVSQEGLCDHAELESAFDRLLLIRDGLDPMTQDLSAHLALSREDCALAARCYPPVTGRQFSRSLKNMALFTRILGGQTAVSREFLEGFLPMLGGSIRHFLLPRVPREGLEPLCQNLLSLYDRAADRFPGLARQLWEHIRSGEPLGEYFSPIFG